MVNFSVERYKNQVITGSVAMINFSVGRYINLVITGSVAIVNSLLDDIKIKLSLVVLLWLTSLLEDI